MACRGCEARRRYLVNGITSAGTELHARFIKPARELLEQVKNEMLPARLKQHSRRYTNEEGVKLSATSRFGQDEMVIDVPVEPKQRKPKDEQPDLKITPYLWVGARVVYNTDERVGDFPVDAVQLGLLVVEPGRNGMVLSPIASWNPLTKGDLRDPNQPPYVYQPLNLDAQDVEFEADRPWVPPRRHHYTAFDFTTQQQFTRHLLRHYDVSFYQGDEPDNLIQAPHDPLATDADLAARVFPPDFAVDDQFRVLWDQVVVLDPDEGGAMPTSKRPQDKAALRIMSEASGVSIASCVLAGDYIVKVFAFGSECKGTADVFPYNNYGWNETQTVYFNPLTVEVEVRVGKEPHTKRARFTTTISAYSENPTNVWPFGDPGELFAGTCLGGTNPHGPMWSQSAILANPLINTIKTVGGSYVPTDLFVPGGFVPPVCVRQYWDVYVQIFQPQCAYAAGFYGQEATDHIWPFILEVRQGLWGDLDIPEISEADILAAANSVIDPVTGEGLYHYNPSTNVFTPVAYTPGPDVLGTPNTDHLWEDEFRHQSVLACRGFMKVRLGFASPIFDPNVYLATDPASVIAGVEANCEDCRQYSTPAWHDVGLPA